MNPPQEPSLKEAAFSVCRHIIRHLPLANTVRPLLHGLTFMGEGHDSRRGQYGYEAKAHGRQFLSYLLLDEALRSKEDKPSNPLSPDPLAPEERAILIQAHFELHRLNQECLEKSALNGLSPVVNPYSGNDRFVEPSLEHAIPESLTTPISDLFEKLPAVRCARRAGEFFSVIELTQMPAHVNLLDRELRSAKSQGLPTHIFSAIMDRGRSVSRNRLLVGLATLSVFNTMRILDQLLFQAFAETRLSRLNFENTIKIRSVNSSGWFDVAILDTRETNNVYPNAVVYVDLPREFFSLDTIARIESMTSTSKVAYRTDIVGCCISENLSLSRFLDAHFTEMADER